MLSMRAPSGPRPPTSRLRSLPRHVPRPALLSRVLSAHRSQLYVHAMQQADRTPSRRGSRVRYDVSPRAEAKPWPNPSRAAARERLNSALGLRCLCVSRWRLPSAVRPSGDITHRCGLPLACHRPRGSSSLVRAPRRRAARGPPPGAARAAAACRVRRYMLGRARGS